MPVIAICWVVALVPTIPLWFDHYDADADADAGQK